MQSENIICPDLSLLQVCRQDTISTMRCFQRSFDLKQNNCSANCVCQSAHCQVESVTRMPVSVADSPSASHSQNSAPRSTPPALRLDSTAL